MVATSPAMTKIKDRHILERHPEVRALARLEGWPHIQSLHPSRLAEDGEHLRMTAPVGSK
jgi:hypothetical protein